MWFSCPTLWNFGSPENLDSIFLNDLNGKGSLAHDESFFHRVETSFNNINGLLFGHILKLVPKIL